MYVYLMIGRFRIGWMPDTSVHPNPHIPHVRLILLRENIPEGEKLLIIRDGERCVLKPLSELEPALKEDLLLAEKIEQAFEEYRKGTFTKKTAADFSDDMASWEQLYITHTLKRSSTRSKIPSSKNG